MAEPTGRKSNRIRKPKIHFDDQIIQSSAPSKPSIVPKALAKPKPVTNPTEFPTNSIISDPIKDLCSRTEELGIEDEKQAKKKAKAVETAHLTTLDFQGIQGKIKPLESVQFEPFLAGDHWEPKLNIPSNIDPTDPLALLDLFIPAKMYIAIAENTNLYAIAQNAPTTRSPTNSRYWYPTNEHEIRVFFGILYYMGIHREPNFRIY